MMMNKLIFLSICCLGILLSECKSSKPATSGVPVGTVSHVGDTATLAPVTKAAPDAVAAAIASGQTVYQNKCYQCHVLPKTADYTKEEWAGIMVKMSRKANLSEEETNQVLAFVNASAKP
jgi:mono/diheme cytochrome c family protein